MLQMFLDGFLNALGAVLDFVLSPLNSLIDNIFPDMSNAIILFTQFIGTYVGGLLAYFGNFIPPYTKTIIILWLVFLISYHSIVWAYTLIVKLWNLIQKLKFW